MIVLLRSGVYDRQSQADQAAFDNASSWGGEQSIAGPFLQQNLEPDGSKALTNLDLSLFTISAKMKADVELETQVRKRTVHAVTVYTAKVNIQAAFAAVSPSPTNAVPSGYRIGDASRITLYVKDVTGLEGMPTLMLGGATFTPYTLPPTRGLDGTWLAWNIPKGTVLGDVAIKTRLRGVRRVSVLPSGASNDLTIAGDWPHPSFDGARLPDTAQVNDAGFSGRWAVSALATGIAAQFTNLGFPDVHAYGLGVSLMPDVDPYKMLDRATKYGLMVVALTFLVLLLFEVRGGLSLHPIPYLLMGSALVLFFMALLSLAQYMPFWLAYTLSTGIIIGMVGSYAKAVLAKRAHVITLCGCLAGLYALLYAVLRLQDFAMLGGTSLLLCALGGTMYLTRDINWNAPAAMP